MAQASLSLCSFHNGAVSIALTYDDVTLAATALVCTGDGTSIWVQYSDPAHSVALSTTFTVPTGSFPLPGVTLSRGPKGNPSIPAFSARCPA